MMEVVAHPGGNVFGAEKGEAGEFILQVKAQQILVPAGLQMKTAPERGEKPPVRLKTRFHCGIRDPFIELGEPANKLQIPQPSGGLLHIWFQVVNGPVVPGVPIPPEAAEVLYKDLAPAAPEAGPKRS